MLLIGFKKVHNFQSYNTPFWLSYYISSIMKGAKLLRINIRLFCLHLSYNVTKRCYIFSFVCHYSIRILWRIIFTLFRRWSQGNLTSCTTSVTSLYFEKIFASAAMYVQSAVTCLTLFWPRYQTIYPGTSNLIFTFLLSFLLLRTLNTFLTKYFHSFQFYYFTFYSFNYKHLGYRIPIIKLKQNYVVGFTRY